MVNPSSYQCVDVAPAKFTFATIDRFIKAIAKLLCFWHRCPPMILAVILKERPMRAGTDGWRSADAVYQNFTSIKALFLRSPIHV
jgi:hypothetical protein